MVCTALQEAATAGQLGSHLCRRHTRLPHCRAPCPVRLCPYGAERHTHHCIAQYSTARQDKGGRTAQEGSIR
jgi:hypothetical protein